MPMWPRWPRYGGLPEPKWRPNREYNFVFRYAQEREVPYYVPEPGSPALFPMRKQDEPRLVWPKRGGTEVVKP